MSLLDHLCAGTWDIDESAMARIREVVERHETGVKLDAAQIQSAIGRAPRSPNPRDRQYEIHQGVAIVPVQGMIHKHASQVQDVSGPSGTSYEAILAEVRTAMADPDVRSVLLHTESPGGYTDGNIANSRAIATASAAAGKPVWSLIDGMGCSAGFCQAISAARVYATPSTMAGSIGTLHVLRDSSAAAEKAGHKTVVVRSAPMKGGAAPGEPITAEHLAEAQRMVNGLSAQFYAYVGERRGLTGDALAAVCDGRVHLAADAQALGLIDGVASLEQVLAMMTNPNQDKGPMPKPKTATRAAPASITPPVSATADTGTTMKIDPKDLNALVAAHPAHSALIVSLATGAGGKEPALKDAIEAALVGADLVAVKAQVVDLSAKLATSEGALAAAQTAHTAALAAKDAELATVKASLAEAEQLAGKKGVSALADPKDGGAPVDAVAAYNAKRAELKAAGDKTPAHTIATKFPEIHSAFVAASNQPQKGATK